MATTFAVGLKFSANGVDRELRKLQGNTDKLDKAVRKTQGSLGGASNNVRKFGRSAQTAGNQTAAATKKINGLGNAIRGAFAAFSAFQAAKFVIVKTAELETQTRSLKVLTGSLETAQDVIKELQDFGAVTPFTSSELIETAKRLKAFGVDTEKLVATTKRLGDVAGATGADLGGVATAFGQIVAKGRLQGEELLQLQERGINLQDELQKMYGLTGEEFRKALEKGQISAEAVELALENVTKAGGKYADGAIAQSDTLAGKFSTLVDNVTRFSQSLGQILSPTLSALLDQVNDLIGGFNRLFESAGVEKGLRNAGVLDDARRLEMWKEATKEAERLLQIGKITKAEFAGIRVNIFQESLKGLAVNEGLIKQKVAPTTTTTPGTLPPLLNQSTSGSKGGSSSFKPSSKAQALIAAAKKLGISPLDLATIIEFESGGSPSIVGGAGGNYQGLIQFGPPERAQYGMNRNQSFEEQVMGPVVRFFKDRFAGVGRSTQGASLSDLYATVLAGNPNANKNARDSFGTSVNSAVRDKFPAIRQRAADKYFGGDPSNAGFSGADQGAAMAKAFEFQQKQQEIAAKLLADAKERLTVAQSQFEIEQQMDPLQRAQLESAERQRKIAEEYNELIGKATEDETKKILEQSKGIELQLEEVKLNKELKDLRESATQSITDEIEMLRARLNGTEDVLQAEREIAALRKAGVDGGQAQALVQTRNQLEQQVEAQDKAKQSAEALAGSISSALTDSLRGLIDGSMTAEEALSNAFQGIADAFLDMAMQMITEYLKMQIMGLIGNFFGGGGSIGGGGFGAGSFNLNKSFFAEGGFVDQPTNAMIGEGGSKEYVIPENKMGSAMSRWNAGARGDAVMDGAAIDGGGDALMAEQPAQINISGGVMQFGDDNYIRQDQLPSIISQAGKQGEQRALRRLQMSQSTRRKVGL